MVPAPWCLLCRCTGLQCCLVLYSNPWLVQRFCCSSSTCCSASVFLSRLKFFSRRCFCTSLVWVLQFWFPLENGCEISVCSSHHCGCWARTGFILTGVLLSSHWLEILLVECAKEREPSGLPVQIHCIILVGLFQQASVELRNQTGCKLATAYQKYFLARIASKRAHIWDLEGNVLVGAAAVVMSLLPCGICCVSLCSIAAFAGQHLVWCALWACWSPCWACW